MAKKKNKNKKGNKKPVKKQQQEKEGKLHRILDTCLSFIIISIGLIWFPLKEEVGAIIGLFKGVKPKSGQQFGCLPCLLFLFLPFAVLIGAFRSEYRYYALERDGIETTAVVTKAAEARSSHGRRSKTHHYVIYKYIVEGEEYSERIGMQRKRFQKNDTITIKYYQDSPEESLPTIFLGDTPKWIKGMYELFN